MKINSLFLLLVLSIIFIPICAYAITTEETEINALYKKAYSTVYEKIDISNIPNVDGKKALIAIDCILEIYKRKPNSMEAYFATYLLKYLMTSSIKEKYNELKEKHLPNLNDPDFETAEKIVFLWIMSSQWTATTKAEVREHAETAHNAMINIMNNCKNKHYRVLAASTISNVPKMAIECRKKAIEIMPDHPAFPYIMGQIVSLEYEKNYSKCIEELQKLIEKYGSIETPNGWRMETEYKYLLAYVYIDMKDYENARKYYAMVEKEAPDYWDLGCLKTALSVLNNNQK